LALPPASAILICKLEYTGRTKFGTKQKGEKFFDGFDFIATTPPTDRHPTDRIMGKKKKKGKGAPNNTGKVFRVTVLGRAEAGKTALCMRYVSNTVMKGYEHTIQSQIYHREVDVTTLKPKQSNQLLNDTAAKKKKKKKPAKKKKKNKKAIATYGLQIEDVPGEISGGLEERTAEKSTIDRNHENNGYQQLYHDTANWLGVPASNEGTPLIAPKRKGPGQPGADVEKHVNLLYIPMRTDGYIVMFDVSTKRY